MANYTAITTGAAANASTINAPLGQLDAAIGDITGLPTTPSTSLAGAIGSTALGTTATTLSGAIAEIGGKVAAIKSASNNIAAGTNALGTVTTGNYNTAHGVSALGAATSANSNVALGYAALATGNGSGNVAIGFQAGYFETTNDNLHVGTYPGANEAQSRYKALMYGKFSNDPYQQILNVNAKLGVQAWGFLPIDPPDAPSIGSVTAGGSVDTGNHQYAVTYVTAGGETDFSDMSPIATATSGNKTVNLTNIPTSSSVLVTARKIYRTKIADIALGHSNFLYLVATINDNTTQTYTDSAADSAIAANPSQYKDNSTTGRIYHGSVLAGVLSRANTGWGLYGLQSITTGFDNCTFGINALQSITTGYNNIAMGRGALAALTSGNENTALGTHAMQDKITGEGNVGIGTNALRFSTASDFNTAVGTNALLSNVSGTQNVAVGYAALTTTLGNGNIAIGPYAGYYETGSNKVFIDAFARADEATARTTALVYGVTNSTATSQTLDLNAYVTMRYKFGRLLATGSDNAQFTIESNSANGGRLIVSSATASNSPNAYLSLLGIGSTPYAELACQDNLGWRNVVLCGSGGNVMIGTTTDGMTAAGSLAIAKDLAHRGTKVGFYNTTPITKQTGVAVTAGAIHAALVALGLIAA